MMLKNVVIAGGGIVGTSIAFFLAHMYDIPVTIVDPVGIAPGASGKAGGFLARDWRDGTPLQELHRLGFDLHQQLATEFFANDDNSNNNDVDYRRMTCAAIAVDESATTVQKPRSKKLQDVEWVNQDLVTDSALMGDEQTIAQVHPRKLCGALWDSAQTKAGSKLQLGRIVRVILTNNDDVGGDAYHMHAVELENGQIIPAETLIIACGPWTHEANQWFKEYNDKNDDGEMVPIIKIPDITGIKCHSILVKSSKVLSQAVFFDSDGALGDGDLEVYPRPDGDCYVNGFPDDERVVTEQPGQETLDEEALKLLKEGIAQTASKYLFGVTAGTPHTEQVCYWPETPDGLPLLGPLPGVKGAFIATGHSVWGILQGPATGKAMAEQIVEGESKCVDLSRFGLDRFLLDDD